MDTTTNTPDRRTLTPETVRAVVFEILEKTFAHDASAAQVSGHELVIDETADWYAAGTLWDHSTDGDPVEVTRLTLSVSTIWTSGGAA